MADIGNFAETANNSSNAPGVCILSTTEQTALTCLFPLPTDMQFDASYNWAAEGFGLLGEVVGQVNALNGGGTAMNGIQNLGAKAAATALGDISRQAQAEGKFNNALNPREKVIFDGVKHREFSLTFNIASKYMDKMKDKLSKLNALYALAAPGLENDGAFFTLPPKWTLSIQDQGRKIIRDREVVIKSLSTNLAPYGQFNTFTNGIPIQFSLTIGFLETILGTKELEMNIFGEGSG